MRTYFIILTCLLISLLSYCQDGCIPIVKFNPIVDLKPALPVTSKLKLFNNESTNASVYGIYKKRAGSRITYYSYTDNGNLIYKGNSKADMLDKISDVHVVNKDKDMVYLQMDAFTSDEINTLESSFKVNIKKLNRTVKVKAIKADDFSPLFFSTAKRSTIKKSNISNVQYKGKDYHTGSVTFEIKDSECAVKAYSQSQPKTSGFIENIFKKLSSPKKVTVSDIVNSAKKEMITQYGQKNALFIEFTEELKQSFIVEITTEGKVNILKNAICHN